MWKVDTITIDDCTFEYEAKVYDKPSQFGINEGRISKLFIYDSDDNVLAAYDRGWVKNPVNDIVRKAVDAICELYK